MFLKITICFLILFFSIFGGIFLLVNYINEHHPYLFINEICINKVLYYEKRDLTPAYNPNGTLKTCVANNE